jgi:Fe-S-cluster-containing hydrogenase component 2
MGAASLTHALEALEGCVLDVLESQCVNLRGRVESCRRCAEACPADALNLSTDEVDLDDSLCSSCGACVPACPTGVFSLSGFSPQRFLQSLAGEASVHLHCRESTARGGGVVIPCFHLLDARLVAAAYADGTREFHLHGVERCESCSRGTASSALPGVEANLEAWLGDDMPWLHVTDAGDDGEPGVRRRQDQPAISRRGFLRVAGHQGAATAVRWLLPLPDDADTETTDEWPPFYQGDAQYRRPAAYQALLAERVAALPWVSNQAHPWQTRTLGETCSTCLVCGQRCPTGALETDESATYRAITFDAALCTDCGVCEQVCPFAAVSKQAVVSVEEINSGRRLLVHRELRRCTTCGEPCFPDEACDSVCAQCQNETQMDDEWLAMLDG